MYRWEYSDTMEEALGRLFSSRQGKLAGLDSDRAHVLELIKESHRYFDDAQETAAVKDTQLCSIDSIANRHRRKSLRKIAASAQHLTLQVMQQQRSVTIENICVASTITSSIISSMVNR